jgi:hypothetical protein
MTDADEYRRKRDEEAALARTDSAIPFVRQMHAKLAYHWHELAERVERHQHQQAAAAEPPEPPEPAERPEPPTKVDAELAAAFDILLANRSAAASRLHTMGEHVPAN